MTDYEKFMILYQKLIDVIKDSPKKLQWYANETKPFSPFYRLCDELDKIYKRIASEASLNKTLETPKGFKTLFKKYETRYRPLVKEVAEKENRCFLETFFTAFEKVSEERGEDVSKAFEDIVQPLLNKKEIGVSFDPLVDNPAYLVEDTIDILAGVIYPDDTLFDELDKRLGAWYFFEGTVGINLVEIYERWKNARTLFIPPKARRVNPHTLYELYNEAVRSYVFGNRLAAVTMCRALLEHILTKHYQVEADDLDNVVSLAEKRFHRLKSLRLQKKRRMANQILHQFEKTGIVEESAILDFFKTIETLIDNIPTTRKY